LRAHGRGVQAFRAESRVGQIGLVVNLEPKDAATDSDADRAAAQRGDAYMNRQYLDPVFLGKYPDEMRDIFGDAWPEFPADDFKLIGEKIDFLGVNYYTRGVVRDDPLALPVRIAYVRQPEHAYTETGWEVHPPSLTRTLTWVTERYGRLPLYITENGAAIYDAPHTIEGTVNDPLRVWYFREHIKAVHDAIAQGADVRGYFAWSLLDNYEWSLGYSKRFGIVHVNYETQERTPKASALYYREVIRSNGASLDG
jgi:beta-glucosidase